jgi:hypothetical protein
MSVQTSDTEKINQVDEILIAWQNDRISTHSALIRIIGIVQSP